MVVTSAPGAVEAIAETLDFVLDTVPVAHDLNPYIDTLSVDGIYILVGQLTPVDPALQAVKLGRRRRILVGSLIGGMPETQEVLDFCAEHAVECDIEMLDIANINEAYERTKRGDVRYRFVIDLATI